MTGTVVYAHPNMSSLLKLTKPEQVRVEGGTVYQESIQPSSVEETFLKNACAFAHAAKAVIDATAPDKRTKADRPCFEKP